MTIREMIEAVEIANKVNNFTNNKPVKLVFQDDEIYCRNITVKNYKEFAKYIRDEYIKEIADQILKHKDYELEQTVTFEDGWQVGDKYFNADVKIRFEIHEKR